MSKESCIEKICRLPQDFIIQETSFLTLLENAKFKNFSNDITLQDITNYLLLNRDLIEQWQAWSHNKRSSGYYLSIDSNGYSVGALNNESALDYHEFFSTVEEACAVFILKEIKITLS
jgi:hypothetical protein